MDNIKYSVRMTPVVYSELLSIVEPRLQEGVWESRKITTVIEQKIWGNFPKVVYVVLDAQNVVAYVGSTNRTIAERLSEHVKIDNRSNWTRVMIIPLKSGLQDSELRMYEGIVGRRLRPYNNSKLPASFS